MQEQTDPTPPSYAQLLEQNVQLRASVQSLLGQLAKQQQQILELQARLGKNSANSSKPPSSDGLAKPAPKSLRVPGQRPIGAPKGHSGNTLRQSEIVDIVIEHFGPAQCSACHSALVEHEVLERRQVLELPVLRAQVIEHQRMLSVCTCGAVHAGVFPPDITAPVQYGSRLKAVCVNLNQQHFVPLGRTSEFVADTFGVAVSETSVLAFTHEAAEVLQPIYQQIGQAVQAAPVVCADETGIRIQGKLQWLHCAVTPSLSYLEHHPKRGLLAIKAIGILPPFKGTLVHDGLHSYKQLDCAHSLCNAHHLRELVYVHDNLNEKAFDGWAGEMMDTLLQGKREVDALGGPLPAQRMQWYEGRWLALLDRAERFNPRQEPDDSFTLKRGKHKHSTQFNLLARLRQYKDDVWRFATDVGVPFTNNLAEQALRMSKVRQKVSGCFRTDAGAKTFFAIRSYLQTMRKQRVNLFDCLVSVFQTNPIKPDFAV